MGFKLAELFVQISANGAANVNNQLNAVHTSLLRVGGAAAAMFGAGGGLFGLGKSIQISSQFEQLDVAFTTMLHSASLAKETMADLFQFAATTPFEFPEVAQAGKQLLAYGFQQKEIMANLRMIGDIASGVGAPLGEITYLFGTSLAQGRVMTRDLMQFANRGIPVIAALAEHFQVANSAVLDLAQDGKISFDDLSAAFKILTKDGGQYGGMMEKQSHTLLGLYSTLKDNVTMSLKEIGDSIVKNFDLKGKTESLIEFTTAMKPLLVDFVGNIVQAISFVGEWGGSFIKAAAGVVAFRTALALVSSAFRTASMGAAIFNAMSGPAGWAKLIAGAAAAAIAIAGISAAFDKVASAAAGAQEASAKVNEETAKSSAKQSQEDKHYATIGARLREVALLRRQQAELGKKMQDPNLTPEQRGDLALQSQRNQARMQHLLSPAAREAERQVAAGLFGGGGTGRRPDNPAIKGMLAGEDAKKFFGVEGKFDNAGRGNLAETIKRSQAIRRETLGDQGKFLERMKEIAALEGKVGGLSATEAAAARHKAAGDQADNILADKKPLHEMRRMGLEDFSRTIQEGILKAAQEKEANEKRDRMVAALENMNKNQLTAAGVKEAVAPLKYIGP
ncbi:MAG TPA: tape measure protein [Pirellulales bacterium]|jgi:hypothetical protein